MPFDWGAIVTIAAVLVVLFLPFWLGRRRKQKEADAFRIKALLYTTTLLYSLFEYAKTGKLPDQKDTSFED